MRLFSQTITIYRKRDDFRPTTVPYCHYIQSRGKHTSINGSTDTDGLIVYIKQYPDNFIDAPVEGDKMMPGNGTDAPPKSAYIVTKTEMHYNAGGHLHHFKVWCS